MSEPARVSVTALLAAALVVAALGVRFGVGRPVQVVGRNMLPGIEPGTWVWASLGGGPPLPGETVIVRWPGDEVLGAARVVATGPASVSVLDGGTVVVDGEPVHGSRDGAFRRERYIGGEGVVLPGGHGCPEVVVPEGWIFVLSDARATGGDSCVHGPVPVSAVLGRYGGP